MPEVSVPYVPGTPCWVDLMVPDQRAALDFYRDLFGWQGEPGPPETGGYAVCTLRGKPVAGIMTAMAPEGGASPPTAWTTYLAVENADETTAKIAARGGAVLQEAIDVMDLGRMAAAADPMGAVFGLWEARDFIGSQVVNEPGSVVWNELNTADPSAAEDFYGDALGLTVSPMQHATGYFSLNADGRMVAGMQGLDRLPEGTPPALADVLLGRRHRQHGRRPGPGGRLGAQAALRHGGGPDVRGPRPAGRGLRDDRRDGAGARLTAGAHRPESRVTFWSFFSWSKRSLALAVSHFTAEPSRVARSGLETGTVSCFPSPPVTPFIAQNIEVRSHSPMSLSTMRVSSPEPITG
ncbi:hypothetical protein GCM10020000_49150 [Streptomyces olivoverticillatus]